MQFILGSAFLFIIIVAIAVAALFFLEKLLAVELSKQAEDKISIYAFDLSEQIVLVRQIRRIVIALFSIGSIGGACYFLFHDSPQQGFVMEWLNLIVRWAHVVAGIMWIGASFYFIFLENNLNRSVGVRDELAGNLWAIHGGGFYFLEKYKIAPKVVPKNLHWFKYEAYFTWLTGFAMLTIVYYMDAHAFLIDPRIADITSAQGIGIGIGSMVVSWIIYDGMCKSSLVRNTTLFTVIGLILLACLAFFLTHVFNSRAAFIHMGAIIGTLMAWNVYFVIIPSQKALVKAAVTGQPLDPVLGKKAGERSLHNNYLTLPVIFTMISNHFPSTFGHANNWIILIVLTLASGGIKHYWNLRDRGARSGMVLPVSIVILISLAIITAPSIQKSSADDKVITFPEVQLIFGKRCVQCHSSKPTDTQWTQAPNGVMYDTPEQIKKMSDKIMMRAVLTNSMPQGNKTNMTDEEREIIRLWIIHGAKID